MGKFIFITVIFLMLTSSVFPCSSLIVTRGASQDSSIMITYTCDGEFHPHLEYLPAADFPEGDSLAITNWQGETRGYIEQVPHTYAVVGLMNEHQVAIGETTFDGRLELRNKEGLLHYWDLMMLALQRAKTAREVIEVMTSLVAQYSYGSTGETFSIADKNEAWLMEMIGRGPGETGANWVAVRIPDGYISCHANMARITEFPLDDPENCLYDENVIQFAIDKGYYDPESGKPFSFADAYCPPDQSIKRACACRVWSIYHRASPSQNISEAFCRGDVDADRYPLWMKPDKKITVAGVADLMRDHYEGTSFDLTVGIDAGPYASPYRWRPLYWRNEDSTVTYQWERAVSTQQTGFSFISQSRNYLPDIVGGVYWYGLDDTWFTCYTPLYCGINDIPVSYTTGEFGEFSETSAWWVFNFVSNFCQIKYSYMNQDVVAVRNELEGNLFESQPIVEYTALAFLKKDSSLAVSYLTDYSVSKAENAVERWRKLGKELVVKYNDGYVRNDKGRPESKGYPEAWMEQVYREKGDSMKVQKVWHD